MVKIDGLWRCGHNSGYGNSYGCGLWKYKKDVRRHENKCTFNPKNMTCFTCWHYGGMDDYSNDICLNGYSKSYARKKHITKHCTGWFYEYEFNIISEEERELMSNQRQEAIMNSVPKSYIPKWKLI